MANQPAIPLTLKPNEPTLMDVLNQFKRQMLLDLNCHHVGTIQEFDVETQTASATINYPKTFFQFDPATQAHTAIPVNYPILLDCPVVCLGGGSCALTFPIQEGDECLVLFNDRAIDNWLAGGAGAQLSSARTHSFSDGVIIVGLRSIGNALSNYDTNRAVLKNGTTLVGVGETQIKLANQANGTVGVALTTILTALQAFLTATSSATTASQIATAASTMNTAIVTAVTNIEGILE